MIRTCWIADGRDDLLLRVARSLARYALVSAALVVSVGAGAQSSSPKLEVELNKLEQQDKGCRVFFVVNNESPVEYEALKLDLVLFQPDGVISRRLLVNLAPLKATKRTLKQFDLDGMPCDQVGSLLINDVTECRAAAGAIADCLSGLTVKSLTKSPLSK